MSHDVAENSEPNAKTAGGTDGSSGPPANHWPNTLSVRSPNDEALNETSGTRHQNLLLKVEALLRERNGPLPIWVRAPVQGPEFFSGITRPKLYQLAAAGHIRSVSLKEPGKLRGVRLFNLESILRHIAQQATAKNEEATNTGGDCAALKNRGGER